MYHTISKASLQKGLFALLAYMLLAHFLHASHILRNDLLKLEAVKIIEEIGSELQEKTGIYAYVIATNEHFPERFNLVEYTKQYEANMTKPYVVYLFAPYATITKLSKTRGRVGIIPSSENVRSLYDYDDVRDAGINIVALKDSNSNEDKFNIGILQAYSVLADNIAAAKGVTMTKTIPDEMGTMVSILRILVYSGTAVLLWIFVLRPFWMRRKDAKEQ